MTDQEIFEKVRDIAVLCMPELKEEDITMESVINRDMGIDSMNFIMILCKVEAAFDIRVPDEDWPRLSSMRDVIEEVKTLSEDRIPSAEKNE